jgi:hypothetical protein
MQKLALNVDELQVEAFVVATGETPRAEMALDDASSLAVCKTQNSCYNLCP